MHPQSNPFPCFLFVTVPLISVTEAASHCSPCSHPDLLPAVLGPEARLIHLTSKITALLYSKPSIVYIWLRKKVSYLTVAW
jgi:hypothetical protein